MFKTLLKAFCLLIMVTLFSCGGTPKLAPRIEITKTETITKVLHDTVFKTEKDNSSYHALLDCQNSKIKIKEVTHSKAGKTHLNKPKVEIKDNILYVDCEAREQELRAKWESENREQFIESETTIPIYIEKPYSIFLTIQIWLGRLFILLVLGLCTLSYIRWKIKK
ncbi:hypothetical protein [Flavobacterium sp. '19STA2R22 D10 B1']|uniref:hypothetical protein n=1 Tax=Flavobacterium aerium TaxID=3037261 RepID=UPI00278C4FAD|nr:hypothetical protein [Flavobacterium sp. '19STA2R22 D10 B1']